MKVFVKFLGYFSQITGRREEKVTLEKGSTVEILLQFLLSKYGREFKDAISGQGFREALIVVNGKKVEKDYVLGHGDEVIISYPIGGGITRTL